MNHTFKIILVSGMACFFCPAKNTAQNLQNLTLDSALALARGNKPILKTYTAEEQIIASRLAETKLGRGVKLSATAEAQVNPFLPASVIPVGQFNLQNPTDETRTIRFGTWWQAAVGLTANVNLYDPTLKPRLREQAFQNSLTANDRAEAEADISAEASRAYYALLLAEEEIRYLEANLERARAFLTDAEQLLSGGAGLPSDVNSARMQLSDAQLRLEQAEQNRDLARKNLLFRMGLPYENVDGLRPGESLGDILKRVESLANDQFDLSLAEQNRPDLQKITLDNQLQILKTATEKSRLRPGLSAGAFLGLNNFSDKTPLFGANSWYSNGNAFIKLTIPLSERWELRKHVLPLTLKQQQNVARLDDLRQQLRLEFESARSAYALAQRQLPIRQNDIALAQTNLDLAREKYSGGGGLASGVIDAETTLQEKQYAWMQTAYNLLLGDLGMRLARGEVK